MLLAQYDRTSRLKPDWDTYRGGVASVSDVNMIDGEQPVGETDRQLIRSTLLQLADTDADPWMRALTWTVATDKRWRQWRLGWHP